MQASTLSSNSRFETALSMQVTTMEFVDILKGPFPLRVSGSDFINVPLSVPCFSSIGSYVDFPALLGMGAVPIHVFSLLMLILLLPVTLSGNGPQSATVSFQCDDPNKLKDTDTYTSLPASPAELNPAYGTTQGNVFFRKSEKEMITIETLLCSTKITQNSKYSKGFVIEYLRNRLCIFKLVFR